VEARICAETVSVKEGARGFLPSGGTVLSLKEPSGPGVRTDSGLTEGTEVGSLYDPMLSKVIAYGPDRATALRKLRAALAETVTLGVQTNAGFLRRLLAHPAVVAGDLDTGLVEREVEGLVPGEVPEEVYAAAALLRQAALSPTAAPGMGAPRAGGTSPDLGLRPRTPEWVDPFSVPSGWRLGGTPAWTAHHLQVPGHDPVTVRVRGTADGGVELLLGTERPPLRGTGTLAPSPGGGTASRFTFHLDGVAHTFAALPGGTWLGRDGDAWQVRDHDPVATSLTGAAHSGADSLTAPMPGTVTVVKVAVGDEVAAGQSLLVVEAMKMEHVISAPHAGTVSELDVTPGTTVAMDQILAVIAPHEQEAEEAA
jgi:acetyl-CoA/propionyl-CoA carboxylase biotin carboxyl carrier protein